MCWGQISIIAVILLLTSLYILVRFPYHFRFFYLVISINFYKRKFYGVISLMMAIFAVVPCTLILTNHVYFILSASTHIGDIYTLVIAALAVFALNRDRINEIMKYDREYLGESYIKLLYTPLLFFYKLSESKYFTYFVTVFVTFPFIFSILNKQYVYLYQYLLIIWQISFVIVIICTVFSYLSSIRLNYKVKEFNKQILYDQNTELSKMMKILYPYLFKRYIFNNDGIVYNYWSPRNLNLLQETQSYNPSNIQESIKQTRNFYNQEIYLVQHLYKSLDECINKNSEDHKFTKHQLIQIRDLLSQLISTLSGVDDYTNSNALLMIYDSNADIINELYKHSLQSDFTNVIARPQRNVHSNIKVSNYLVPKEIYEKISNSSDWTSINIAFLNEILNPKNSDGNSFLYHYVNDDINNRDIDLTSISYKALNNDESPSLDMYRRILDAFMNCEIYKIKTYNFSNKATLIKQLKCINGSYYRALNGND